MRVAFDLDNTLIMFHEFWDANYLRVCKHLGIACFSQPRFNEFEPCHRYNLSPFDCERMNVVMDLEYPKMVMAPEYVKLVVHTANRGWNPMIITHRPTFFQQSTEIQIAPLRLKLPDIQIVYTEGSKSEVMQEYGVDVIVDDSTTVIEDVLAVPQLAVISPLYEYNVGRNDLMCSSPETCIELLEMLEQTRFSTASK